MFNTIRRIFRALPSLPSSLRQDLQNPVQRDRLPDARNVELEFPVVSGSLADNRRLTRKWFFRGFLLVFILGAIEHSFGRTFWHRIPNIAAACGFALAWIGYLSVRRPRHRWFLAYVVTPHAVLALLILDSGVLCILLTVVLGTLVADLFATHYVHLQTTAPMGRQRALALRQLWRGRFALRRALPGGEFYSLAIAVPAAAAIAFLLAEDAAPPRFAFYNVFRVTILALSVGAGVIVVEMVAAFLFARRVLNPRSMFRHFGKAVTAWITYNRGGVEAPGAYQTPAGNYQYRKFMALGLVLLTVGAFPEYNRIAWQTDLKDIERELERSDNSNPANAGKRTPEEERQPPSGSSQDIELEVYQRRMLERMSPEDRDAYLARLRRNQQTSTSSEPQPIDGVASTLGATSGRDSTSKSDEGLFWAMLIVLYGVVIGLVFPLVLVSSTYAFLFSFAFATTARVAARFGPATTVSPEDVLSADRWEELVQRVQNSGDDIEKRSLLLGVNASDNTPVLIPREVFTEHAHLLGDSGSGKTSIGIASILSQLMRPGDCSVVVLDLKGDDLALFHGVRADAERAGLRFRWFTNLIEHATHAFNPLLQRPLESMTLYQKVDMLTTAMGLQYGRDYGRAYYSDANAQLLLAAFERHARIDSFEKLAVILGDPNEFKRVDRELRKAGAHLGTIVNRLADLEALNVVPENGRHGGSVSDAAIQFADVFREPQAVHFHLSSTVGTTSSAEIARIALYSLLTAASTVAPKDRVQTFVVIDEFQRIVAGNVEMLLQLARSLNIGVILANQSLQDLKTGGINLIPAISANTRFRQIFAASHLEEQELVSRGSGEALTYQQAWHEYLSTGLFFVSARQRAEHITPRLRLNDILLATDHPLQSIVQVRRGAGYAQYGGMPFVMRSTHHISLQAYRQRKEAPWPAKSEETLVSTLNHQPKNRPPAWQFSDQGVFVDEASAATSGAGFLDELYQQHVADADQNRTNDSPSSDLDSGKKETPEHE